MTPEGTEITPVQNGEFDDSVFDALFDDKKPDETISPVKPQVSEEVKLTTEEQSDLKQQVQKQKDFLNHNIKSVSTKKHPPTIWFKGDKGRCYVGEELMIDFLVETGYGQYNGTEFIKRGKDKILKIVDTKIVSKFIYDYFMGLDSEVFHNPDLYGVEKSEEHLEDDDGNPLPPEIVYFSQQEVRSAIIKFKWFSEKNIIYLSYYTDDDDILSRPKDKHLYTPIFKDTEDYVYTYFRNGIVKTDMNGSSLMSYNDVSTGYIWESQILPKSIEIDKNRKGVFVEFVEKAMSYRDDSGKWILDDKEYQSFRTTYGYMLSNYCNNGDTPAPVFVDRDSDGKHAEGGNGKSLIMGSVKQWKKTLPINGKNISEKDKFLFSGVFLDTEFIFLDDVNDDFNFKTIYNYTTSDMEIERKFKDRFVISMDKKPKIGLATNYILPDTDYSTLRRQYIVEFGSYWHDKTKNEGISVQKYFDGKRLFGQDWSKDDWLDFYNFGFKCIEEYLSKGVVQNPHSNYKRKQLVAQIEGVGINDGVCEWIINYVENDESSFKVGVEYKKIYSDFTGDFEEDVLEKWESTRFKKCLFEICKDKKWLYNPHKTGDTLSSRRWLIGSKGNQVEKIRIHIPPQTKM
jgi:hypothetical protein